MSFGFTENVEVDESNCKTLKHIGRMYRGITFTNFSSFGSEIDEDAFYGHMERVSGKERIERLTISYHSSQCSAKIVSLFPNLHSLFICGHRVATLDGIESFKGEIVVIETGDNRKRDISKLAQTRVKRLEVHYEQPEDLCVISRCLTLDTIWIHKFPGIDFYQWRNLPLTHMKITNGAFVELRNLAQIKALNHLMVGDCRKFARFTGDNSCVTHLIVDGCRHFCVRTITELQNIRHVTILGSAMEIALSELPQHSTIHTLSLWGSCKAVIDMYDIKSKMPMLEELSINTRASKEERCQLAKSNPSIRITF